MERLAIIIKGFSKSEKELEADRQYIEHYVTFLTGAEGGAWDFDEEIIVLEDPMVKTLEGIVDDLRPDFALLIMIGHGATQDSKQLFQINKTTVIQAGQVALDVNKQLVILESCRTRVNTKIETVDLKDRLPQFRDGGVIRRPRTKEEAKNAHLSLLRNCPNGLVICYPCQDNEVASGYYFSFALLTRAFEWHLLNYNKYFPIIELMEYVSIDVRKRTKNKQTPIKTGTIGFPFVISKF